MDVESVMPLVAGTLALAISAVLARMYLGRRGVHHLLWSVGMLLWAVSDITQFYAFVAAWTVPIYLSYFFGSIMLAGFLGAGTLCLVLPKSRISSGYMWFNVIAAVALAVVLATTPINASALQAAVTGANPITSPIASAIAAVVNIPALFTFAGGALYSFIRTRRPYALLITAGALIPAGGGTLATIALPQLLPYTDFFGILVLGAGFYLSFSTKPVRREVDALAGPTPATTITG